MSNDLKHRSPCVAEKLLGPYPQRPVITRENGVNDAARVEGVVRSVDNVSNGLLRPRPHQRRHEGVGESGVAEHEIALPDPLMEGDTHPNVEEGVVNG